MTETSDQHPELQRLLDLGVTEEQIKRFAALCLPENLLTAARPEDLLDSQDSVDLAKRLRAAGISCATSFDFTPQAATIQRPGGDLWLGIVWVMDAKAAGELAEVLIRKLKGWLERNISKRCKVHLCLRVRSVVDGRCEVAEIGFCGGGRVLIRMLEGFRHSGERDREPTQLRGSESSGE